MNRAAEAQAYLRRKKAKEYLSLKRIERTRDISLTPEDEALLLKQDIPTSMNPAEPVSTAVAQPPGLNPKYLPGVEPVNKRPLYNPEWDVTVTPEKDYWKQVWKSVKFEAKEIPQAIKQMPLIALKSIVDPAGSLERYATADEKAKGTAIQKAMGEALKDVPGGYDVGKGWLEHMGRLVIDAPAEFKDAPLMTVGDALLFMSMGKSKGRIGSYAKHLPKEPVIDVGEIKVGIPEIDIGTRGTQKLDLPLTGKPTGRGTKTPISKFSKSPKLRTDIEAGYEPFDPVLKAIQESPTVELRNELVELGNKPEVVARLSRAEIEYIVSGGRIGKVPKIQEKPVAPVKSKPKPDLIDELVGAMKSEPKAKRKPDLIDELAEVKKAEPKPKADIFEVLGIKEKPVKKAKAEPPPATVKKFIDDIIEPKKKAEQQFAGDIYKGDAWRTESGLVIKGKTAKDIVDFEVGKLGNKDIGEQAYKIAREHNIDLSNVPEKDVVWITKSKADAVKYGTPDKYDLPKGSRVLATDGEGGYLVLKPSVPKKQPIGFRAGKLKTAPATIANLDLEVTNKPITEVSTDVSRFQNRIEPYSPESVQNIIEGFDPNKLDPVVLWKDPATKTDYVISGHSRLEAVKRLGYKNIPARYFKGTEGQAVNHAIVEANRMATKESLVETLNAYKKAKAEKYTQKQLRQFFSGDVKTLEAIQHLDPKGKFIEILNQPASSEFPYIKRISTWVGQLRKEYGSKLTSRHESQLFDFIYKEGVKNVNIAKDDFFNLVSKNVDRMDWQPNQPLVLRRGEIPAVGTRGRHDTGWIEKEIDNLQQRIKVAKTTGEVQALKNDITKLRSGITEITRKQGDIFAGTEADNLVRKFTAQNVAENIEAGQKGFVRIPGKKGAPSLDTPRNQRIEQMYKQGSVTRYIGAKLSHKVNALKNWTGNLLDDFNLYRRVKKKYPGFYLSLRELPGLRSIAGTKADDYIMSVVGKLKNKKELDTFARYVQFKDFEETIRQGKKLPNNLKLFEVQAELKRLSWKLTPEMKEAANRHFELQRAIGKDLINRGRLFRGLNNTEAQSQLRKYYYRHEIIDHPSESKSLLSGLPSKIKQRFRPYTLQRKGSALPIELDYIKAMKKHYTQYLIDNAIDDFIQQTVTKLHNPKMMKTTTVGETTYNRPADGWVEWRDTDRIRVVMGVEAPQRIADMMLDDLLTKLSQGEIFQSKLPVKDVLNLKEIKKVIGKQQPYIIPQEIANVLENIKAPDTRPAALKAVNTATTWWKLGIVNPWLNPGFFWLQVFGDPAYLLASKARAFAKIPKTAFEITKERIGKPLGVSAGSKYYQEALKRAGIRSGFFAGGEMPEVKTNLRYWRFMTPPEKIWNAVKLPVDVVLEANIERENLFRMARFVYEIDKGTDPSLSAKFARETGVDYGAFTAFENSWLRQALMPFYAFAKGNTAWWTKQLVTRPHSIALKFALPYYLVSEYNESKYPEIEKNLKENESTEWIAKRFHIILGKDKEGRPIIFSPNSPLDDYMEWFDISFDDIKKHVYNLSGIEKAKPGDLWKPNLKSFIYKGWHYVTPLIKAPIEADLINYNTFKKRAVVPKYLQKLPKGEQRSVEDVVPFTQIPISRKQRYYSESFFAPFRSAKKIERGVNYGKVSAILGLPVYNFTIAKPAKFPNLSKDKAWHEYLNAWENNDPEGMSETMESLKYYYRSASSFERDFKYKVISRRRSRQLKEMPPEERMKAFSR